MINVIKCCNHKIQVCSHGYTLKHTVGENLMRHIDWSRVPRIKTEEEHLLPDLWNLSESDTNLLICCVENKYSKWTVLLPQMRAEAQSWHYETERNVLLPVHLLRNSAAKTPPHRSHRMHLQELESTHALIISFTITEKCYRPQKDIFSSSFGHLFSWWLTPGLVSALIKKHLMK